MAADWAAEVAALRQRVSALEAELVFVPVTVLADNAPPMHFELRSGAPFSKVMRRWCVEHGAPEAEVQFQCHGAVLRAADTPKHLPPGAVRDGAVTVYVTEAGAAVPPATQPSPGATAVGDRGHAQTL
eukprot:6394134-Pyramimonas_sp.AAC.1